MKTAQEKRADLRQFQKVSGREKKAAANAVCLHVSANKNSPPERPQTLRGARIRKNFPLQPGYRLTSSSSSARFTCSAVGGTASGRG